MNLTSLVNHATDKKHFQTLQDYINFCQKYLQFIETGLQARIVSQNENHYQFYQYRDDGSYNITRPVNTLLMYFDHFTVRYKLCCWNSTSSN